MMLRPYINSARIILLAAGLTFQAAAQAVTVSGVVLDTETGNPIPDADIFVEKTPFHASSRDGGYFFIDRLPCGEYSFRADVVGYEGQVLTGVGVRGDTTLSFGLTPKPIQMDPVLITGTRSEHLQSHVAVSSKVLTSEWIEKQNANTAVEAIEASGDCFVKDGGGFAGLKTLSIRGSGDSQVLVLLDGQRLNSAQDGGVDLNAIPVETLEKIEIVRGGHSALMGTDAVGGTVHLVTRNSLPRKGFRYGMLTTVGSFNTMAVCAYGAQRLGPVDLFAGYNRTGSDGDFPYTSSLDHKRKNRENNDYSGNQLFFKARYHFMETGRLQLLVHYTDSDRGSPGSLIYPSLDARRKEEQKVLNLQFENQLMKRIRLNAQAYVQGHANRYHAAYGNDRYDNSALGLDLVAHWIVHSNVLFTSGVEVRKDDAESSKYPLKTRNTQSLILQFEINHGLRILGLETKWKWTPAVRLDHYQAEKNHTCPKIGVLLNPFQSAGVNLRANYGESFRLPTFNDLYYPPDEYGTHGNPLLRPETGRNLDVGVGYRTGGPGLFSVEWTYFENRFRDLIVWESDANWIFSPVNVGKARISGIENEWIFRLPNGDATLSVAPTWMTGKDLTEHSKNLKLIYRPEFKLDIVGGFKIIGFGINVNVRRVGMRYTRPDNSASLPAYETVNGNIQRGFSFSGIKISAKLQINNLFDKSIEITEGYPIPGRDMRFSFGLDW